MKGSLSIAALVILGGVSACRNPIAPESRTVVLDVVELQAPSSVTSTTPFDVVLTVLRGACQSFSRIEAQRTPSSVSLTVLGKDPEKGCIDLGVQGPMTYRVNPPFGSGSFTVTVNRGALSPLVTTVEVH